MAEEFTSDLGVMPYNTMAEQSVLGAILLESSMLDEVLDFIKSPDYFYVGVHKLMYREMMLMMNNGIPVDPVTLIDRLEGNPEFESSGGKTYVINIADSCPSYSNAGQYAKIVADKYKLRQLITASRAIIDDATEGAEDTSLILDAAEQRLFDIRSDENSKGLERINSVILQTFDRLDDLNSERDSNTRAIPTGIGDLDRMITGLNRSDLIILAARPGMGKTSFALNIARNGFSLSKCRASSSRADFCRPRLSSAAQSCARASSTTATGEGLSLRATCSRTPTSTSTTPRLSQSPK